MRIHTFATRETIAQAARDAGVYIRIEQFGSRTHPRSFDVKLRGSSNRAPMFSYTESPWGTGKAATWDEWGIFLGSIFRADPLARAGGTRKMPSYANSKDFHAKTCARFMPEGKPHDYHGDHSWVRDATGKSRCRRCSAIDVRWASFVQIGAAA